MNTNPIALTIIGDKENAIADFLFIYISFMLKYTSIPACE